MTSPLRLHRRRWRLVTVLNPGAGSDWQLAPPGGFAWRVVSVAAVLTTSAGAANRIVFFSAGNTEKQWYREQANATQVASQVTTYCAHTGATHRGNSPGTTSLPLPAEGLLLQSGHAFRALTENIQAGDQWSAIHALVDEVASGDRVYGDDLDRVVSDFGE